MSLDRFNVPEILLILIAAGELVPPGRRQGIWTPLGLASHF
jgi:hypothetical protein